MKLQVIVHPNAKKSRIEKDQAGLLHVYINELPLDGKANKAVIDVISRHFKVKKNTVVLIQGEKFKQKVFEIIK